MKIYAYCAYQERTQKEVRDKLYGYKLNKDAIESIIVKLIEEGFVNEERFAKAYAGGKFRVKKWGRRKIIEALKSKDISDYCIKVGLKEIPEKEYRETLTGLIAKLLEKEDDLNEYKKKHKVSTYLIGRGYEPELVWDLIKLEIN